MRWILALLVVFCVARTGRADTAVEPVRQAIEKALPRIEAGVTNYPTFRGCFSCHHQAMALLSLTAARKHGFTVDEALLKKVTEFSAKTFRQREVIARGQGVGGKSQFISIQATNWAVLALLEALPGRGE